MEEVIQKVLSSRRGGGSLKSKKKKKKKNEQEGGSPSMCVRSLFLKKMLRFSK